MEMTINGQGGWVVRGEGGRVICLVQGSLAAEGCAQCGRGECHDVTPAAAAEDDGGPSASHFMRNHFPAKGSPLTPSTILIQHSSSRPPWFVSGWHSPWRGFQTIPECSVSTQGLSTPCAEEAELLWAE